MSGVAFAWWTPTDSINMRGVYEFFNVTNITIQNDGFLNFTTNGYIYTNNNGNLEINTGGTGEIKLRDNLNMTNNNITAIDWLFATFVNSTSAIFGNNATVNNLNVTNNVDITNNLTVGKSVKIGDNLNMSTTNITDVDWVYSDTLNASSDVITTNTSTDYLNVTSNADVGGNLTVSENVDVTWNLTVTDTTETTDLKATNLESNLDGTGFNITLDWLFGNNLNATSTVTTTNLVAPNLESNMDGTGFNITLDWLFGNSLNASDSVITSDLKANNLESNLDGTGFNITLDWLFSNNLNASSTIITSDLVAPNLESNMNGTGYNITADNFFGNLNFSYIQNKFIDAITTSYLYMSGTTLGLNETILNQTINNSIDDRSGIINTNSSNYWDALDDPSDINAADITDDNTYVTVSGDTMTGNLIVNTNLTVDTNTLFVDSNNNRIGIGTIIPTNKLHVTDYIRTDSGLTSIGHLLFVLDSDDDNNDRRFAVYHHDTSTELFRVQENGNVGITGTINVTNAGNITMGDSQNIFFGDGNDAYIEFDGSKLIIKVN